MFKFLEYIPRKRVVADIFMSIIWGILYCTYGTMISSLTGRELHNNGNLLVIILGYVGIILLWEIIEWIEDTRLSMTSCCIENEVSKAYFNKAYYIEPHILKKNNTGYISGLLTQLVSRQIQLYDLAIATIPFTLVYLVYFTIYMSKYHILFGIGLLLIVVIASGFTVIGNKVTEKHAKQLSESEANRNKLFVDTIINIGTVQKMQANTFMENEMCDRNEKCWDTTKSYTYRNEIFFCGYKFIIYMYAPICVAIYSLIPKGTIDQVELFSVLTVIAMQFVHVVKDIGNTIASYLRYSITRNKIDNIICDDNIRQNISNEQFNSAELHNIKYSYIDRESEKNITIVIPEFRLKKGDCICIHGESGQGKTTLLNILSGEIANQRVVINNHLSSSRLDCVFISQDTEIFDMTLEENLTLGNKDIYGYEIVNYLNQVGLGEWYDSQEDGLNTILGERGVFVSTGQRQRLNLVRGLLRTDKEIYLLDEPTSNVDEETEKKMVQLIKKVLKNKTVVIVTHRPRIMEICNKSYEFIGGVLQEEKIINKANNV